MGWLACEEGDSMLSALKIAPGWTGFEYTA